MRSDMGRVVIEAARNGSASPTLKIKRVGKMREDEDGPWFDGPWRVPSSGRKMHAIDKKLHEKSFTDVLGPLNGYLMSSVGRPWDDVFSELSKGLGAFSWPLRHILEQHVDVEVNTFMVGRKVYAHNKYGVACVSNPSYYRHEFYVHPVTRLLCTQPVARDRRWRGANKRLTRVEVPGSDRWYVWIKGIWFIGTYHKSQFYGAVRRGNWGNYDAVPMEWPNFNNDRGSDVGTWFFHKIKQADKKEAAEARQLWQSKTQSQAR